MKGSLLASGGMERRTVVGYEDGTVFSVRMLRQRLDEEMMIVIASEGNIIGGVVIITCLVNDDVGYFA